MSFSKLEKMTLRISHFLTFLAICLFSSCDKGVQVEAEGPKTTFESIQGTILSQNCSVSGCHNSTSHSGGLDLESSASYSNLVNAEPTNTFARTAKFVRVRPFKPDSSFLFLKIDGTQALDFGNRMPSNSTAELPSNYREFIRQWIQAGAPREGEVADARLIRDPIVSNDTFTPPSQPQQGLQLQVRPFAIDPLSEREIFVYNKSTNADSLYVNRIEVKMRPGSHHFILYSYNATGLREGEIRDLTTTNGEIFRAGRQLFIGSQTPMLDHQLPPNVVLRMNPYQGFDYNSHYVNTGSAVKTGEVYVNLHTVARNDSTKVAVPIFDNYVLLSLPRGQKTTVQYTWTKSFARNVFMLSSHSHKRGESFKIFGVGGINQGRLLYENYDWDHPPLKAFSPPLRFEAGEGYRIEVTYNNNTDRDLHFGITSEDEMCIVVGYYYN